MVCACIPGMPFIPLTACSCLLLLPACLPATLPALCAYHTACLSHAVGIPLPPPLPRLALHSVWFTYTAYPRALLLPGLLLTSSMLSPSAFSCMATQPPMPPFLLAFLRRRALRTLPHCISYIMAYRASMQPLTFRDNINTRARNMPTYSLPTSLFSPARWFFATLTLYTFTCTYVRARHNSALCSRARLYTCLPARLPAATARIYFCRAAGRLVSRHRFDDKHLSCIRDTCLYLPSNNAR